ncbi:hypothetical protein ACSBR1_031113 [Camellia fascicularis]
MLEVPNQHNRLICLALRFFHYLFPSSGYRECLDGNSNFKLMLRIEEDASNRRGNWPFILNTTELREAGVKVEKVVEEGNLFAIKFQTGVLQIPPLTIEDITESFFRNLIAYEQYCIDNHLSYVPDYVRFVDCLIDSPKDVEIPSQSGIINNWLGDDEVVSRIFNKISDAVTVPSNHFRYGDIFNKVNIHCIKRGN